MMNILNLFNPVKVARTISARKLWKLMQSDPHGVQVIDTRTPAAFLNGHVPHAINRPYHERKQCLPQLPVAQVTVLYGPRAAYFCDEMPGDGQTFMLQGGWLGWVRAGLPIEPPAGSLLEPGQVVDGLDRRLVHQDTED